MQSCGQGPALPFGVLTREQKRASRCPLHSRGPGLLLFSFSLCQNLCMWLVTQPRMLCFSTSKSSAYQRQGATRAQKFGKMPVVCTGRRDSPWSQPSSDAAGQYLTGERGHEKFLCSGEEAQQNNSPWKASAESNTGSSAGGGGAGEGGLWPSLPTLSGRAGLAQRGGIEGHGEAAQGAGFAPLSSAKKAAEWMIQEVSLMLVLSEVSFNSKFRVFSYLTIFFVLHIVSLPHSCRESSPEAPAA